MDLLADLSCAVNDSMDYLLLGDWFLARRDEKLLEFLNSNTVKSQHCFDDNNTILLCMNNDTNYIIKTDLQIFYKPGDWHDSCEDERDHNDEVRYTAWNENPGLLRGDIICDFKIIEKNILLRGKNTLNKDLAFASPSKLTKVLLIKKQDVLHNISVIEIVAAQIKHEKSWDYFYDLNNSNYRKVLVYEADEIHSTDNLTIGKI